MKRYITILTMAFMICVLLVPANASAKGKTKLSKKTYHMYTGQTSTNQVKLKNYKKLSKKKIKKVKWTSSNEKVATVKPAGKYRQGCTIKAKTAGTTTIKVKYNGKTYKCKLTVGKAGWMEDDDEDYEDDSQKKEENVVTSVTIQQAGDITLTVGDTYQLTAETVPANAPITWKSTNPEVASVDQNGLVTILKGGTAGIWCYSGNRSCSKNVAIRANLKAKYTYECYLLGDVYNGGFCGNGLYDIGATPVYIKTENPNPETFRIQYIPNNDQGDTHNFIDVHYETEDDKKYSLRKVEGGYLGLLFADRLEEIIDYNVTQNTDEKPVGEVTARIWEYETSDWWDAPHAEAGIFTFEVKDYDTEMDAWMNQVLEEVTTPEMNVHEKMVAISKYILDNFEYMAKRYDYHEGNGIGSLTYNIGPFFKSYILESSKGPALLYRFGQKIGYELWIHEDYNFEYMGKKYKFQGHGTAVGIYDGIVYEYGSVPAKFGVYHSESIEEYSYKMAGVGSVWCLDVTNEKTLGLYEDVFYHRNIRYVDFSQFK